MAAEAVTFHYPQQVILSTDEHLIVGSNATLSLFSRQSSTLVKSVSSHTSIIRHLAITPSHSHLISSADDKLLIVSSFPDLEVVSKRVIAKRANAVTLTEDGKTIVVADKFGDVFTYPLHAPVEPVPEPPTDPNTRKAKDSHEKKKDHPPILGHVSMLNAVVLTPASAHSTSSSSTADTRKFIVTADRDEHIRVSRFPKGHIIDRFLCGHTKFVSALAYLPEPHALVSGGGDADLITFDLKDEKPEGVRFELEDKLLPYVVVAPFAPPKVTSRRKGKQVSSGGEGADGEEKKVEEDEKTSKPEVEETPTVRLLGPHRNKDGVATGLAVIKIVPFHTGVLVIASGCTALLYIASPLSPTSSFTLLNLHHPVLDISNPSSSSSTFFATLDTTKGTPEAIAAPSSPFVTVSLSEGDVLTSSAGDFEQLIASHRSQVANAKKLPDVATLYPVLSLLIILDEPEDSGAADNADSDSTTGGGSKKKRARVSESGGAAPFGGTMATAKKGKRALGRERLLESLKAKEKKGLEGGVKGEAGLETPDVEMPAAEGSS